MEKPLKNLFQGLFMSGGVYLYSLLLLIVDNLTFFIVVN